MASRALQRRLTPKVACRSPSLWSTALPTQGQRFRRSDHRSPRDPNDDVSVGAGIRGPCEWRMSSITSTRGWWSVPSRSKKTSRSWVSSSEIWYLSLYPHPISVFLVHHMVAGVPIGSQDWFTNAPRLTMMDPWIQAQCEHAMGRSEALAWKFGRAWVGMVFLGLRLLLSLHFIYQSSGLGSRKAKASSS